MQKQITSGGVAVKKAKAPKFPDSTIKLEGGSKGGKEISTKDLLKSVKKGGKAWKRVIREESATTDATKLTRQAEKLLRPEEAGYLVAEGMEKTTQFTQNEIRENVDLNTARKMFNLNLPELGPYHINYSRNGRFVLLCGKKGHIASCDWQRGRVEGEVNLKESCYDSTYLQDQTMYAVAQKKYTYIYDSKGTEIHILRDHKNARSLEYLPYHFLIVSSGGGGLVWQDISTGGQTTKRKTAPHTHAIAQNPFNACVSLGGVGGEVAMWSPAEQKPLAKIKCHNGAVSAIAHDLGGFYMATAGQDHKVKIWDIRTWQSIGEWQTPFPATSLDISGRKMLAVTYSSHVVVYNNPFVAEFTVKKAKAFEYMTHHLHGPQAVDARFCPYEDVLGVGHSSGFSSIVIPGSGLSQFDSYENNPFETRKQRNEHLVHALLDKLPADTIVLDPSVVGTLRPSHLAPPPKQDGKKKNKEKSKIRGKDMSKNKFLRKQDQHFDKKRKLAREASTAGAAAPDAKRGRKESVLDRFVYKGDQQQKKKKKPQQPKL